MCGIAGIISLTEEPVARREVETMCSALIHRGPDEDGFYMTSGVGLGMRRLRIIDLATGRQPVSNEDGTVWVVFNGEIYNYKELRQDLIARGHLFQTATDTETIVHLYEEYGDDCVDHLRGMFTFALWDTRTKRALIARDRLGIKPLYYAEYAGRLYFASELKAILALNIIPREVDWQAAGHLFRSLTTPGDQSILHGIRKLPPAHRMIVKGGVEKVRLESYWSVRFEADRSRSEASFVEELRELLRESVRMHMISDVPLGAFLSGGIDSSAVVAMMASASSHRIKTFSIGFKEASHNELPYARKVAEAFGTEHHEQVLDPDALEIMDKLVWHLDEPFGDPSAIPTYMVSKLASQFVTVVLSGDGGDELFAGYEKYMVEKNERRYDRLPSFIHSLAGSIGRALPDTARGKRFLNHFSLTGDARYLDSGTFFAEDQLHSLFSGDAASHVFPEQRRSTFKSSQSREWLSALQERDLTNYLPLDILTKVDRMSMAHSIESRVPLLDHKLVEFACTIPPEMQIRNSETKHVFKQAMRGTLSDEILDRPKQGFAVPLGSWFRGRLSGYARDVLLSTASRQRGIFNPKSIETLLGMHSKGRDLDLQLWTLISFELWCRTFLDATPSDYEISEHSYARK